MKHLPTKQPGPIGTTLAAYGPWIVAAVGMFLAAGGVG